VSSPPAPSSRAVLRAPLAARVLAASLLGRLPLGAAPLALVLFGRDGAATISLAGFLVGAYTAGMAIGQPLLARAADRARQPPVLWAATAVSTAGFVLVATHPPTAPALVGAAAAGLGAPPFESGLRVLWKDLVGAPLVDTAYTLDVAAQELIFVAGPPVAAASVGALGPSGGLLVVAGAQLVGTAWFATSPAVRRWRGEAAPRHWAGPLSSGGVRALLAATVLVGAGIGSTTVAVAGYAGARGSASWAGWLLAGQALGGLVGGLGYARRRPGRLPRILALLAASFVPLPLFAGFPLPVMLGWLALSGVGLPPALTRVFLTADRVAPPGTAAESFAWIATAFSAGDAVGAALDGSLLAATNTVALGFAIAPVTIAVAAAMTHRFTKGDNEC
jgi:predicted MFS family arabinose efflux permease